MSFLSFFFFLRYQTRSYRRTGPIRSIACFQRGPSEVGSNKWKDILFQEMLFNMFIVNLNGNAKIEFGSVFNPHSWNLYNLHYNLNSFVLWDDITYKLISLKSNKIDLFFIKSISKISEKCILLCISAN